VNDVEVGVVLDELGEAMSSATGSCRRQAAIPLRAVWLDPMAALWRPLDETITRSVGRL
jgi:hypothetical protein